MSGVELTSASEVFDFLRSEGAIADWIRASTLTDSQRIGLGYAVVADRKDRAAPMEAVAWRSRCLPGKGDPIWTYHGRGPSFLAGLKTDYEVQALAVIPAPGKEEDKQ